MVDAVKEPLLVPAPVPLLFQHPFPAGQQPLRERAADPVRSFYRPDPLGPLPRELQQLAVAARIGAEPAGGPQDLPVVPASIVTDSLWGSTPMITLSINATSSLSGGSPASEDGQRYFELSRPFLSHASPRHPARTHAR